MERSGRAKDDQVAFEVAGGFVTDPSCHLRHATLDEPTTIGELEVLLATSPPDAPEDAETPDPVGSGVPMS